MSGTPRSLARSVSVALDGDADVAMARWASSGAMHLTGRSDGAPHGAPARVALAADAMTRFIDDLSSLHGSTVSLNGPQLLGERAAIGALHRQGSTSCSGASRLLRCADGWIVLSLARPSDIDSLEAWLQDPLAETSSGEPSDELWVSLGAELARRSAAHLIEQGALLGLPCAQLGEVTTTAPLVTTELTDSRSVRSDRTDQLIVLDLSALWAGPLCAHVLGLAGARVIKVESTARPDGVRSGSPEFFDLVHSGHESVVIDLSTGSGCGWLRKLIEAADVVIESSRPRALHALGASFEIMSARGWRGVWLSITAHGRDAAAGNRVGFGDDAAVSGGLVSYDDHGPVFCADAVADPLTGLLGAGAVLQALSAQASGLLAVSLSRTAAHVAAGIHRHRPVVAPAGLNVLEPVARPRTCRAAPLGAHTDAVLCSLGTLPRGR